MKYLLILLALGCGGQKEKIAKFPEGWHRCVDTACYPAEHWYKDGSEVHSGPNAPVDETGHIIAQDVIIRVYEPIKFYDVSPFTLKECLVEPGKLCKDARGGVCEVISCPWSADRTGSDNW